METSAREPMMLELPSLSRSPSPSGLYGRQNLLSAPSYRLEHSTQPGTAGGGTQIQETRNKIQQAHHRDGATSVQSFPTKHVHRTPSYNNQLIQLRGKWSLGTPRQILIIMVARTTQEWTPWTFSQPSDQEQDRVCLVIMNTRAHMRISTPTCRQT